MDEDRKRGSATAEERMLHKYMKVGRCHRSVLERCLNSTGVYRSQHRILMCISDHPNISQTELAQLNDVTAATIAVTLSKLEKGGYICRAVDESDKRYNQIIITEKGEKVVKESRRIFQEIETTMFRGFTERDFEIMLTLFDRILENLNSIDPDRCREDAGSGSGPVQRQTG